MPAQTRQIRRGLPRVRGGEPWPPAAHREQAADPAPADAMADSPPVAAPQAPVASEAAVSAPATPATALAPSPAPAATVQIRRGLPRVPGGDPWPPAGVTTATASAVPTTTPQVESADALNPEIVTTAEPGALVAAQVASAAQTAEVPGTRMRRGLPRVQGGDPWPPADVAPVGVVAAAPAPTPQAAADDEVGTQLPGTAVAKRDVSTPLPFRRTVWPGAAASVRPTPRPEPERIRGLTKAQWAGRVIMGGGALLVAAFLLVTITRWFVSLEFMRDFLTTHPGETHLPEGAPVGIPAWLGWQHFFNTFLMVLIIRTGLQVRTEKRPAMFWSPRGNPKRKISLALWFHQSLDILWIANGVIFIALLFATGQWMRIVPTSWEVLPNALSAAIQYVSLDWPTENGWVNYNSLQVLAYFTTTFIAAPLAIVTGVRMSGVWPKDAARLNKAYPLEWARAIHFPVMLYFVAFIVVHVALVFATGALRNLNHMYASQGSVDPSAYTTNWVGFWIFFASLGVIVAGWTAARPMVLSGIARAFGTVSGR